MLFILYYLETIKNLDISRKSNILDLTKYTYIYIYICYNEHN